MNENAENTKKSKEMKAYHDCVKTQQDNKWRYIFENYNMERVANALNWSESKLYRSLREQRKISSGEKRQLKDLLCMLHIGQLESIGINVQVTGVPATGTITDSAENACLKDYAIGATPMATESPYSKVNSLNQTVQGISLR